MLTFICSVVENPDDREFMTQFYLKYERLMYATVKKYLSDPETAKDIVQECVLHLICKISFLRGKTCCIHASYVVSTVRNTTINHLRKQGRISGRYSSLDDVNIEDMTQPGPSLDAYMLQKEQKERLVQIWAQLPDGDQLLLEGKYILGYQDAELAAMLGCQKSSIRMKLTRARRRALHLMNEEASDLR